MKFKIGKRELDFDIDSKLISYKDKNFLPSVRTYGDMKKLYKDGDYNLEDDYGLYFMYRDVFFEDSDKQLFEKNEIRYDITILIPKVFSGEYNKTYGHYHPENAIGKKYQELYQVLSGKALYLQQNNQINYFTEAKIGDSVNMDESFGHVTINPSEEEILIMCNLVDDTFSSVYDDFKNNDGANYYFNISGWEKNEKYNNNLELKEKTDMFPCSDSIYDDFLENPDKFNYLH